MYYNMFTMANIISLSNNHRDLIIERLAQQTSLRLPGQLSRNEGLITEEQRSIYLRNLLTHDPGVFLERHGDELFATELEYFHPLRSSSYEIYFYMKLLENKFTDTSNTGAAAKGTAPSSGGTRKNAAVKNRRLAKLEVLEDEGYFKMEAMRSREPYLYHLYIGQYTVQPRIVLEEEIETKPPSAIEEGAAGAADVLALRSAAQQLAGDIMDQHDKVDLLLRREAERETYALREQEEESESEETEEDDKEERVVAVLSEERSLDGDQANIPGEWPAPEDITHEQR
jgi:Coiled-coil domain containing protein (DUF2052)